MCDKSYAAAQWEILRENHVKNHINFYKRNLFLKLKVPSALLFLTYLLVANLNTF